MDNESNTIELSDSESLQALERFVIENDDLLDLEARVGRFNIFDALGVVRTEIRHSNFLAWLLDPAQSHGQGQLFLKAILMDLLRQAPTDQRPMSPVALDGAELSGVEIRREWRNIDILILIEDPHVVITIENKIDAGEHTNQLARYKTTVSEQFAGYRTCFVFLTPGGDEPSEEEWITYTYEDIHRVLSRVMRINGDSIGEDVTTFIGHYVNLIGSRLMPDAKIDTLCERIYKNHKQALDLIIERVGDPGAAFIREFAEKIAQLEPSWSIKKTTTRRCEFIPTTWTTWLPNLNTSHRRNWLYFEYAVFGRSVVLTLIIASCSDLDLRASLLSDIQERGKSYGFTYKGQKQTKWIRAWSQRIFHTKDELGFDETLMEKSLKAVADLKDRTVKMEKLIKSVLEEHNYEV